MTAAAAGPLSLLTVLIWFIPLKECMSEGVNISTLEPEQYPDDISFPSVDYSGYSTPCSKTVNRIFRKWLYPIFFSIICLLGVAGNLLVILTVFHFKRLKTMTDVYLLNLSFADLLFALSLPFWAANSMTEWVLGQLVCKSMHTIYKVSFYSSMLFLCLISIDRYFAIAKAISSHRRRTESAFYSKLSSTIVWVMALIFSIPEMAYANISNNTCSLSNQNNTQLKVGIQASQIALAFILPLLIMGFCYASIIKTLCQARSFERNKAIKVILAVMTVFLVSQVPYNIVLFLSTTVTASGGTEDCDYDVTLLLATDATQALAFFRCCLNPFVYAFIGVKFQHDLLKLLKEFGCMSQEFYRHIYTRRKSSGATNTETTTTFSP